jgi:hypothetical protein
MCGKSPDAAYNQFLVLWRSHQRCQCEPAPLAESRGHDDSAGHRVFLDGTIEASACIHKSRVTTYEKFLNFTLSTQRDILVGLVIT